MRIRAGRHPAHHRPVVPDRLVADDVGRFRRIGGDVEVAERPSRAARQLRLHRGAADEVVIELERSVHSRLYRRVDRTVLACPGTEHLLHAQRHQRPESEQADAAWLPGLPQQIEQCSLVLRCDPDLVAKIPGVGHPADVGGDHPDVDPAERQERVILGGQGSVGDRLQHVAGARAGQREAHQGQAQHVEPHPVSEVAAEPARVMRFGDLRAEQEEVVCADPRHGKLPDDVTARIQGGGEVDPARSAAAGW